MAKGIEDTAFYRWHRLVALNEVGGDPARFGVSPEEFHAFAERLQADWPADHDDAVHPRHQALGGRAGPAGRAGRAARASGPQPCARGGRPSRPGDQRRTPATEYLFWQTLVGTWRDGPLSAERLVQLPAEGGPRGEAAARRWTEPDAAYERAVTGFARGGAGRRGPCSPRSARSARGWPGRPGSRCSARSCVQLTMPGVPDVYQGTELVDLSLVDPDNRRPVDFAGRRAAAGPAGRRLEQSGDLGDLDLDAEKLLVTSRALRLRREHPALVRRAAGLSTGRWPPPAATPWRSPAATRPARARSPWPPGCRWRWSGTAAGAATRWCCPTAAGATCSPGCEYPGGSTPLAELLQRLPVALLQRLV